MYGSQTCDLAIKKVQTQNVYDFILMKVTVVLPEITWCTLQGSKHWSPHQSAQLAAVYYFSAILPHMYCTNTEIVDCFIF